MREIERGEEGKRGREGEGEEEGERKGVSGCEPSLPHQQRPPSSRSVAANALRPPPSHTRPSPRPSLGGGVAGPHLWRRETLWHADTKPRSISASECSPRAACLAAAARPPAAVAGSPQGGTNRAWDIGAAWVSEKWPRNGRWERARELD